MAVVAEDHVVQDLHVGPVTRSDSCFAILTNVMVFLYLGEILLSFQRYSVFEILFNPVITNDRIRPESIFGDNLDAILLIPPDLIHHYVGIRASRLDPHLAIRDLTQLNLSPASSLHLNPRSFNFADFAPQNLWLGIDPLNIKAHKLAIGNDTILNHNPIISLGYQVQGSLIEVCKSAIRNLHIRVDANES